ncbi:MAG: AAA family ATPase, partial [Planctomycetes bacterium]|nr:AAA family ATPase [Planctomycetota bacterium]
ITRVTRGLPFPQVPGHESVPETPPAPGKVVFITLQDYCTGLAKRLQVQGADLENLHLEGFVARQRADTTRMPSRSFDFTFDLQKLQQELDDLPSIRLLVVDPLCDFCQGPAHVAQMLTELRNMAQILDIPVVVTLPAQTRFDAAGTLRVTSKYRNDAARAVWCLATDPKQGNRRFFIPRRTNLFALPRGVEFQIDNRGITWHPENPVDPADPLGWETRLQGCLNQLLRNDPKP